MKLNERAGLLFIVILPLLIGLVINLSPQTIQVQQLWQQVETAQKQHNYQIVADGYQNLQELMPWRTAETVELARASYQINNWQAVITAYEMMPNNADLSHEDLYRLAEAYWQLGNLELTRSIWDRIRTYPDNGVEDYQQLIIVQHQHQDWFSAYQTLLAWQANLPHDNSFFYELGLSQIIYDPESAEESLIRSLETQNQRIDKVKYFQSALPSLINEQNAVMRLMFAGNLLSHQNEWDYAAAAYALVLRTVPDYAEAWALYSNTLSYLGKDGSEALLKAQALDQNSTLVQAISAYDLRREGRYQESIIIWKNLSIREPKNAVWYYEQGITHALAGDFDQALTAYQAAVSIKGDDPFYWKELARFSVDYSIGLDSIGLEAARKALSLNPDDSISNDLLGWVFFNLNDYVSAERFVLKAQQLDPYSAIVHLHLGQIYIKQNKLKAAGENLEKSIQLAQNPQIKKQAEQLLSDFILN